MIVSVEMIPQSTHMQIKKWTRIIDVAVVECVAAVVAVVICRMSPPAVA